MDMTEIHAERISHETLRGASKKALKALTQKGFAYTPLPLSIATGFYGHDKGLPYITCLGASMGHPLRYASSYSRKPIARKYSGNSKGSSMELVQVKTNPDLSGIEGAAEAHSRLLRNFAIMDMEWNLSPMSEYERAPNAGLLAIFNAHVVLRHPPVNCDAYRQHDNEIMDLVRQLDFEPVFEAEKGKIFNSAELSYKKPLLGFLGGGFEGLDQLDENWDFYREIPAE